MSVQSLTLLHVELTQWTQHPSAVDVRPTLTEVLGGRQLQTGFFTSCTVRLADVPVGVRHVLVGPDKRLPDPWCTTRRGVGTLTTCPVALVSGQAKDAWSHADT